MLARMATREDIARYRRNWQDEIDSAWQYRAMADGETQASVAQVYRDLAAIEEKHAGFWEKQLAKAGETIGPAAPSWRARVLSLFARKLGARIVLPTVAAREYADRDVYATQPETTATRMTAQEHTHARVLAALGQRRAGVQGTVLARVEGRHRNVGGNALRAAVLGANDGLCSNLSLVMGVAGATVDSHVLLVTGLAGLLAGACSMAIGEWVSVASSRELAQRELRTEAEELAGAPEDEREELQLIYEAKGLTKTEAAELSRHLMKDPKTALDVLSREELGIDPEELGGSAWTAALTSFVLFALGAIVPVAPFFAMRGWPAIALSIGLSGAALVGIGAAITLFTGRSVAFSAARQLALGFAAAGITFAIGKAIGVAISS
jgi:VIT1/CCC1 family predicted Fe2+/Mn2+ transporter